MKKRKPAKKAREDRQRPFPRAVGVLPAIGALTAILFAYFYFATYGTYSFFQEEYGDVPYDHLGESLLHGHADVPDSWEASQRNGKYYLYFGALPAIFHGLASWLLPGLIGKWGRLSCFLAALVSLAAFYRMISRALDLGNRGSPPPKGRKKIGKVPFLLAFAFGTPLSFLVSTCYVYNECILWGLASSLWGVYFLLRLLEIPKRWQGDLFGLSVCAATALHTRLTFALPLGLSLSLVAGYLGFRCWREKTPPKKWAPALVGCVSPALLGLGLQLWYNAARYGSPWRAYAAPAAIVPEEQARLAQVGIWNLGRLSMALINYFGVRGEFFSPRPPFFRMPEYLVSNPSLAFAKYREWTISLTIASSWLVVGALWGFILILRRPRSPLTLGVAASFIPQWLCILGFAGITQRYCAEFLPLLVFLFCVTLRQIAEAKRTERFRRPVLALGTILCVLSCYATLAGTASWMTLSNWAAPAVYRAQMGKFLDAYANAFSKLVHRAPTDGGGS
jgi:hypothetical protein